MQNKNRKNLLFTNRFVFQHSRATTDMGGLAPSVDKRIERIKDFSGVEVERQLKHLNENVAADFDEIFHRMITPDEKGRVAQFQNWKGNYHLAEEELKHYMGTHPSYKTFLTPLFETLNRKGLGPKDKEYQKAEKAFDFFMKGIISQRLNARKNSERTARKLTEKSEPAIDRFKKFGGELVRSFKEGDGWDKGAMVLSGIIIYKMYKRYKDKKFFGTDFTWQEMLEYAGSYWALNVVSVKMTGKELLEHAGVKDVKGALGDSDMQKFAQKTGIENPHFYNTMANMWSTPMSKMITAYQNALPAGTMVSGVRIPDGFIDPISVGYPNAHKLMHDKNLDSDKSYVGVGRLLYQMMYKFNGIVKGDWKKYEDPKAKHTVGTFMAKEMVGVHLLAKHSALSRIKDSIYGVFGRRGESLDILKFRELVNFPEEWKAEFPTRDDETKAGQADMKFKMRINHIPVEVTKVKLPGEKSKKNAYKFDIEGVSGAHTFELGPNGELSQKDKDIFMGIMQKDVARRARNIRLRYTPPGRTARRLKAKDIYWDSKEQAWIGDHVTIPKTDFAPAGVGRAVFSPLPEDGLGIKVEGTNIKINLDNKLEDRSPMELNVINDINNNSTFKGAFLDVTSYMSFSNFIKERPGHHGSLYTLQIGSATLPLEYRQIGGRGRKQWTLPRSLNQNEKMKAMLTFVTSSDFVNAKMRSFQAGNTEVDKVLERIEDNFMSAAESNWKHFGTSFVNYVGGIFSGKGLKAPTLNGVSGSVLQNYGTARMESLRQEVYDAYTFSLGNLRTRPFRTYKDVINAMNNVHTGTIVATARNLEGSDIAFKAENRERHRNDEYWKTKEIVEKLSLPSAVAYQNDWYGSFIESQRQEFMTLDFAGLDNSDWMMKSHKLREHAIRVITYNTRHIAFKKGTDIDGDGDIESIAPGPGGRPPGSPDILAGDTDFAKYHADMLAATPGTRAHRIAKKQKEAAIQNFKDQMFVTHVANAVFHKMLADARRGGPIDVVIKNITNRPVTDKAYWGIPDTAKWDKFGPKPEKLALIEAPKINAAEADRRLQKIIDSAYREARASRKYEKADLDADKAALETAIRGAGAVGSPDPGTIGDNIASAPSRLAQEAGISGFRTIARRLIFDKDNKKPDLEGPSWVSRAWDGTKEVLKQMWPGNW